MRILAKIPSPMELNARPAIEYTPSDLSPREHDLEDLIVICCRTVVNGIIIELHQNMAHLEPSSYQARLEAAKGTASLIRFLSEEDYKQGCIVFGVCDPNLIIIVFLMSWGLVVHLGNFCKGPG